MSGILNALVGSYLSSPRGITVVHKASTSIKTAGTNNLTSGAITTTQNKIYVVLLGWDPVAGTLLPTVSLSDGTNTYTSLNSSVSYPTGTLTAGTGVITQAFTTTATTTATVTITATFSSSITAKAMTVIELTGATTTQDASVITQRPNDINTPIIFDDAQSNFNILITYAAAETNTAGAGVVSGGGVTYTSFPAATTSGGSASTNISLTSAYYLMTASNSTITPATSNNATNWVMQTIELKAA